MKMVLNNSDSDSPSGITTTFSSQPHQFSYCSTTVQLVDDVTNRVVSIDKWIAQELDRLSHNYEPRNCINYEALLSVIEGYYYTEPYLHQPLLHLKVKEPEISATTPSEEKYISNIQPPTTTVANDQLTQRNLILAFIKLIHYCQNERQFFAEHYRKPLELLIELEKVNEINTTSPPNDEEEVLSLEIQSYQKKLEHILFGTSVPIMKNLVNSWTMICLWVQQDTCSVKKQQKWIIFGVYSYQMAKNMCDIHHKNNKK